MSPTTPRRRPRAAFTLVELLVVIGIIALLVSILLPALNKARRAALNTQCASNIRQIATGVLMYANDHNGTLPITRPSGATGDATKFELGGNRWYDRVEGALIYRPGNGNNQGRMRGYLGGSQGRNANSISRAWFCPFVEAGDIGPLMANQLSNNHQYA